MHPRLTVCGIDELRFVLGTRIRDYPITHIISLWDPPAHEEARREIDKQHDLFARTRPKAPVLTLYFDDIQRSVQGLTEPGLEHMREVLAFARQAVAEQGEDTHVLVHCRMGISRSTACALAILAQANPDAPPHALLDELGRIREWMAPNPRLIQFADQLLERREPLLPAVLADRERLR